MKGEITRTRIEIGETAATIICEERFVSCAVEGMTRARAEIKNYIRERKDFLLSLEPLPCSDDAPVTIRRMCDAASKAGVGPMASVAGTIAWAGVERAVWEGATHCLIDNGGDIALVLDRPVTVGILEDICSTSLPAVRLDPTDGEVRGICTSSGVFGHSISFGNAKAATVMADDPALADAAATALGNACKSVQQLDSALGSISRIEGIRWALAIVDDRIGILGDVPGLTLGKVPRGLVTVHSRFPTCVPIS
jgi:ApbE superfamily uncharacterized protein (UPF0280 family)